MSSSELRYRARQSLAGKWGNAILAALVAAVLGGLLAGSGFQINIDEEIQASLPRLLQMYLVTAASVGGALGVVQFILGGVIELGYARFLLKQHDGEDPQVNELFSQFDRFGAGFCQRLLRGIYVFLWTLLFIIPGIVASLKYAMTPFIMAENPNMTASQAIDVSKELMEGHKGDLFILNLSFFGWGVLSALTLGIGSLWLNPYINAAQAAFYRSIRGERVFIEEKTE